MTVALVLLSIAFLGALALNWAQNSQHRKQNAELRHNVTAYHKKLEEMQQHFNAKHQEWVKLKEYSINLEVDLREIQEAVNRVKGTPITDKEVATMLRERFEGLSDEEKKQVIDELESSKW